MTFLKEPLKSYWNSPCIYSLTGFSIEQLRDEVFWSLEVIYTQNLQELKAIHSLKGCPSGLLDANTHLCFDTSGVGLIRDAGGLDY